MHERAVVADLIRKASEVAAEQGAARVVGMRVTVGALSHIEPAALAEQLEDAATGTPMEGARFDVRGRPESLGADGAQAVVLESVKVEA